MSKWVWFWLALHGLPEPGTRIVEVSQWGKQGLGANYRPEVCSYLGETAPLPMWPT